MKKQRRQASTLFLFSSSTLRFLELACQFEEVGHHPDVGVECPPYHLQVEGLQVHLGSHFHSQPCLHPFKP